MALVVLVLRAPKVVLGEQLLIKYASITFLTLEYSEIEAVEIVPIRAMDFGGLGIRYSKRRLAFIPRSGQAIALKLKSGESVLVYSRQPEILQTVIKGKLEQI
jgi:hypothetical protein